MYLTETQLKIIYAVAEIKKLSIELLNELYLESNSFIDYLNKLLLA